MNHLPHRHLATLTLDVDFANIAPIGATPAGRRGIAPVTGGRFEGERLNGIVHGGHDWFLADGDGALTIDVRLTLATDDGALIYLAYRGKMRGSAEAMQRFRNGEQLSVGEYDLQILATFECGDPRYSWLNDVLAVGIGEQTRRGPVYHIFEIGTP